MLEFKNVNIVKNDNSGNYNFLENLNLNFNTHKIYSLFGCNGSGKSTLLKLILNIYNKDVFYVNGEIIFKNVNLINTSENVLNNLRRNEIKYVPQDAVSAFDPLKNYKYYFDLFGLNKTEIEVGLDYFEMDSYEKICSKHPYEVSGGMAQRLAILCAIMQKPSLLLLDEPTASLDTPVLNLLKIYLRDFVENNNSVAICVTHDKVFSNSVSDLNFEIKNGSIIENE